MSAATMLGGAVVAMQRVTSAWPQIRATGGRQTFVDPGKDDADTPFRLLIRDTNGNTAYRLECHNGNYEVTSEITFSGDFHCALFAVAGNQRRSGNLLAEDAEVQGRSDWLNRGRMTAAQLRGRCADTPYGTTRVFRLRGMHIVFRFIDLKWLTAEPGPKLQQFAFGVTVNPDLSARTSTAELTSAPKELQDACL